MRLTSSLLTLFIVLGACTALLGDPIVGEVPQQVEDKLVPEPGDLLVETWVRDLEVPWELVFLTRDRALVTERPGRVRVIEAGQLLPEPYLELTVSDSGEGGLMGMAIHPEFPEQPFLYLMYTYSDGAHTFNKVERYSDRGNTATFDRIIIDKIPGARNHNGGRIGFGPDGMLYVTTGEIFRAHLAQDLDSLAGKILRVTPDGEIPEDNPFPGSPVYSYGHRNPQGLAWHPVTGDLFSSEHGPSGEFGLRGHDIINVVCRGGNHGWPLAVGAVNREEFVDPLILWREATPPAGMAFWRDQLYVATLRSRTLIRIGLDQTVDGYLTTSIERLFAQGDATGRYGRLRAAVVGPDGALYVTTSNRDGRGDPQEADDRILRITPR